MTVHRPPDRPSHHRYTNVTRTLSSYFGRPGSPGEIWLHFIVVVNCQLSKQGIRWPVSPDGIAGSGVDPSRSSTFLKLSVDKLLVFKWSKAQVYIYFLIHTKYVLFMSLRPRTINIFISNWPRTRKINQLFKNTSREDRCFSLFSP